MLSRELNLIYFKDLLKEIPLFTPMYLTASKNNTGNDLLLDTSLSFEARSLYILIDSLSGNQADVYAPSLTVLAATTNWTRTRVRALLAELVDQQLVQELAGHEERYTIREYKVKGDRAPSAFYPFARAARQPAAAKPSLHNVLSQEEISALMNGFC